MAKWYIQKRRQTTIDLYWWRDFPNVGDRASPYIVQYLTHCTVLPALSSSKNKLLGCGSILHNLQDGDRVWGTGAINPSTTHIRTKKIRVYSVRGPLTRKILTDIGIDCPEIYGDPALLLPIIFTQETVKKEWEIGIIPHYVDFRSVTSNDPRIKVLDVRKPLKKFLGDLWKCERVLSSSLHGVVFAEAYGIPAERIKVSNGVVGGEFKFNDYYLGTGREPMPPLTINEIRCERDWLPPKIDQGAMVTSLLRSIRV